MPSSQNLDQVQTITTHIDDAQAVYLVDYSGLTANQMTDLRQHIRNHGGLLHIIKNNLFTHGLRNSKQALIISKHAVTGTTAALYAREDPITPLKAFVKYAKDYQDLLTVKAGYLNSQTLDANQVNQLAQLPGIDQLRAQLVGLLANPMQRLVGSLGGNLTKLVIALDQIKEQKAA